MTYLPGYDNTYSPETCYHAPSPEDGLHVPDLESVAGTSQPPSPVEEAEVDVHAEPDIHKQNIRDSVHERVIYRTWRSWAFPGSPALTKAGVEGKCPMASCSQYFQDLSPLLLHLERDCEGVKSWVESEYSRAQQAADVSGPLHPCRGRCPWCRTRSLFDNGKPFSLKRLSMKSLHASLRKTRKRADTAKDAVPTPPPPRPATSKSFFPPPPSPRPTYEPGYDLADPNSPAEIGGHPIYPPVEIDSFEFSPELDDTSVPASVRYVDSAWPGVQDQVTEPPRGVSMMSDWSSSTRGRDSLISSYSQPSIPTPSTTISRLSITTSPQSSGPIYADAFTCSPVESSEYDFPPSFSAIELPASVPLEAEPRPFPALPDEEFTFGSTLPSLNTTVPELPQEVATKPLNIPEAPVPAATQPSPPIPRYNEMLECLKDTFSKLRKTAFGESNGMGLVTVGSLSTKPDDVTLLGALDALENALQGKRDDFTIFTFCFAYLVMAMADDIKESFAPTFHSALGQDMSEFVRREGDVGLSWRFLSVSETFLDALRSSMSSSPVSHNDYRGEQHESTGDEDSRLRFESFQEMKTYLRAHPQPRRPWGLASSRQHSYDSTTSTLVEQEPILANSQQEQPLAKCTHNSHSPSNPFSFNDTPNTLPKVPISRHRPIPTITVALRQRRRGLPSTSCKPCDYNPSPGPDQQKKLSRHMITRKHRRRTCVSRARERDEYLQQGQVEIDGEGTEIREIRYSCTGLLLDGSTCTKTFNRKDNLRQHCKRKHPEEEDENTSEVKRRRVSR